MIWAALSMTAALVMTACSNDDNAVETPAAPQAEVKTIPYSVTVSQGGDATTRATVDDDMKTLHFAVGDKLYIDCGDRPDLIGILTLKAGDEGKTSGATFEGTISYTGAAPADDISLNATLVGASNVNFDIVDDIVWGIIPPSAYYDNVKEAVEEYSYLTGESTYGEKEFTLEQSEAFLNFEITFEDGTVSGTKLTTVVSNGGGPGSDPYCSADVTTKTEGGKVVAKFVLPVGKGVTLSGATVKMGDKFALIINDATLDGKVYNVKRTVKTMKTTDLSTIASDYEAQDYEVLTGGLTNDLKISIAHGAIVTLKDVNINGDGACKDGSSAGITCEGDATIILEGTNTVKGLGQAFPGIYVPKGNTLTIMGTGKLTASSGDDGDGYMYGAGIGGGYASDNKDCGNIVIKGGTIVATGGVMKDGVGAGIGGSYGTCGNITISGGNVTAKGGSGSAGIGGGMGSCGDITISGGTVDATGGGVTKGGAGIGSGFGTSCGNITISGGTITAKGGTSAFNEYPAAGIGGGCANTACGVITITSGVTSVTATKGAGDGAQSIGKGKDGKDITVNIEDGANVTQN